MSAVIDPIGDAVSWVGDAVGDVVDFAVDEILEPIGKVVVGVVEGMIDDPFTTIAMIGASMTPYSVWLVPVIAAASTAAKGGSITDVALAAGASYVGGKVGGFAGDYAGGVVGDAVGNEVIGDIVAKSVESSVRGMTTAAAMGGDILDAGLTGAMTGAAFAGISELGDYVSESAIGADPWDSPETETVGDLFGVDPATYDEWGHGYADTFFGVVDDVDSGLSTLVEGWYELPEIVQDVIKGTAASSLATIATTGKLPTPEQIGSVLAKSAITSRTTLSAIKGDMREVKYTTKDGKEKTKLESRISDKVAAQIAAVTGDVVATAFSGADPYAALQQSLIGTFQQDLHIAIDKVTFDGLNKAFDAVSGGADYWKKTVGEAFDARRAQDEIGKEVNARAELANKQAEITQKLIAGETDIPGIGYYSYANYRTDLDLVNAAAAAQQPVTSDITQARERLNTWAQVYKDNKKELEAFSSDYNHKLTEWNAAADLIIQTQHRQEAARQSLHANQEQLVTASQPIKKLATEKVVEALSPGFNDEEYRRLYNPPDSISSHEHWLQTGRINPVNQQEYNDAVTSHIQEVVDNSNLLLRAEDKKWVHFEEFKEHRDNIVAEIQNNIGNDLDVAKNIRFGGIGDKESYNQAIQTTNAYLNNLPDVSYQDKNLQFQWKQAQDESKRTNLVLKDGYWVESDAIPLSNSERASQVLSGEARLNINRFLMAASLGDDPQRPGDKFQFDFSGGDVHLDKKNTWLPQFNQYGRKFYSAKEDKLIFIDVNGKELGRKIKGDIDPKTGKLYGEVVAYTLKAAPNLQDIVQFNRPLAFDIINDLDIGNETFRKLDPVDRWLANLAKNFKGAFDTMSDMCGDSQQCLADVRNSRQWVAATMGAGAEVYGSIGKFWGLLSGTPIDKMSTHRTAELIMKISEGIKPEDFIALKKEFYNSAYIDQETGKVKGDTWYENIYWISKAYADPKYSEVVLWDLLIQEGISEIPTFALGGAAGKAVSWGIKKGAAALPGIIKASKETVEAFAKSSGIFSGMATAIGINVAEEVGSLQGQMYLDLKAVAIEGGATEEQASKIALDRARLAAIPTALITAATAGRVPTGQLTKQILGAKGLSNNFKGLIKSVGIEVLQEGTTDAFNNYFTAQYAFDINPASKEFQKGGKFYDLRGKMLASLMQNVVSAGGVSTAIGSASLAAQTLSNDQAESKAATDKLNEIFQDLEARRSNNPVANAIVNINPEINEAVNNTRSDDPVVSAEAESTIKEVFGYNPDTFAGTTIDLTKDPDGAYTYNTAIDVLNFAQPNKYTTKDNVITAFDNNTALIPFVPAPQTIQNFIGSKPKDTLQTNVDTLIDKNYTDANEVAAQYKQLGYTPSQTEIDQNVGQGLQTEQLAKIKDDVDPRQTTTDEVLEYFKSLGYPATTAEAALFTGQGGIDFQTKQLATIDPYVGPRQVTRSEVERFFTDQNYPATEDEITRFVAQVNDPTFQATQEQKLIKEFDPLAVTKGEARKAYEDLGFLGALPSDIERLTGKYAESELAGRARETLPVATYNSIAEMLGKPGQEITSTDIDFVSDIIAQQEVLSETAPLVEPTPLTEAQVQYDVNADNVIDINDKIMLEQIMEGTVPRTKVASASQFAATGIQSQMQQQTQLQRQTQQQIQQLNEAQRKAQLEAKRRTQTAENQAYMQQLLGTTPVKVETPAPKEIKNFYNPYGENIFATAEQEKSYRAAVPFATSKTAAKGGIIGLLGGRYG